MADAESQQSAAGANSNTSNITPAKRKPADVPENATKRRAPRACYVCRTRKVRCDVVQNGAPCTNCRLDKATCVLSASNRGRPKGVMMDINVSRAQQQDNDDGHDNENDRDHDHDHDHDHNNEQELDQECQNDCDEQRHEQDHLGHHLHHSHQRQDQQHRPEQTQLRRSRQQSKSPEMPVGLTFEEHVSGMNTPAPSNATSDPYLFQQRQQQHQQQPQNPQQQNQPLGLHTFPAFIRPLPTSLVSADDWDYLYRKDALTLPPAPLRAQLLSHFVQHVYPLMPIVDIEEFLTRIAQNDPARRISLLLFQAVMFASVAFVPAASLRQYGFPGRKAARKIFFQRARLLYGLDCESDRMAMVQATLLMTYWYEHPRDVKDTWHWMGITVSLAQVLGLHRDPEGLKISPAAKRLRRRLWWACFIRDRLMALGIRRPARIQEGHFSTRMLALADFETLSPAWPETLQLVCNEDVVHSPKTESMLRQSCIEIAKLCTSIGNILSTQYSILIDSAESADSVAMVTPHYAPAQTSIFARCDSELAEWQQNLSDQCRYALDSNTHSGNQDQSCEIVRLYQAQLSMVYWTTLTILHRPRSLRSCSSTSDRVDQRHSKDMVSKAATAMGEIAHDLHRRRHLRHLPPNQVPAILWAALSHLSDITAARSGRQFASIGCFYECLQALEELRETYASADHAMKFLQIVIQKNDVRIPGFSFRDDADVRPPPAPTVPKVPLPSASAVPIPGGNGFTPPLSICNETSQPPDVIQHPQTHVSEADFAAAIYALDQGIDSSGIQNGSMDFLSGLGSPGQTHDSYGSADYFDLATLGNFGFEKAALAFDHDPDTIIVNPSWL